MDIFKRLYWLFDRFFQELKPFVDLFARVWVSKLLIQQGLQQVKYWQANVFAFQSYYHLKFIHPTLALFLTTALEFILPIFLVLGLGGRLPAFITFLLLLESMLATPFLWTQDGYLMLQSFILWEIALILLVTHGPQLFSLDRLIEARIKKRNPQAFEKPSKLLQAYFQFERFFDRLSPIADLIARVWMARIFLLTGLSRLETWSTTLFMFWYVYQMPPPFTNGPNIVAILTTLLFIGGSIFLILGVAGRLMSFCLFKVNFVTSVMIPFLRTHEGIPALNQHILWGLVLMMMMTYGPGTITLEGLIHQIYKRYPTKKTKIYITCVTTLFAMFVAYLLIRIIWR